MLRCHRTKRHTHDGVGTGSEHIHAPILDQRTRRIADIVRESKTHTFAFTNPVLLHQTHFVWPTSQRSFVVANMHMVQQLLRVMRDVEVVPRNLALLHQSAGAPTAAIDHLFIGQHGLVFRIPIHHLCFAIGDAFLEHLQKQPLVPLVISGVAGSNFARPIDRQAHRLHLLFHVSDVFVSPLGRRHTVFERGIFCGQAKCIPAHRHQDVIALHAQMARQHVVDGVVAHMAHVQLAAGVGQHGAGVILLLGATAFIFGVFDHAVGVGEGPGGLRGALDLGVVVFVLHGEKV